MRSTFPFLSTLPARGATFSVGIYHHLLPIFLSTLPARGATITKEELLDAYGFLSTLPARGATGYGENYGYNYLIFLSTLPARGATAVDVVLSGVDNLHFYPRSPRGERPAQTAALAAQERLISIHAPREGSDGNNTMQFMDYAIFLSTLPARGATRPCPAFCRLFAVISIHAPREGSDFPYKDLRH